MNWAWVGLLAAVVAAGLVWPLLRRSKASVTETGTDSALYEAQLAQIDRDVADGLLNEADADTARLEVGRRLLRAQQQAGGDIPLVPAQAASIVVPALVALILLLGGLGLYGLLGSPQSQDTPFAGRLLEDLQDASPEDLVARLKYILKRRPEEREGWVLLARTATKIGDVDQAAEAYDRALVLGPDDVALRVEFAALLTAMTDGFVNDTARRQLQIVAQQQPDNVAARYFLPLADFQRGRTIEALSVWQSLLDDSPADAPWRPQLEKMIGMARQQLDAPPAPEPPGE